MTVSHRETQAGESSCLETEARKSIYGAMDGTQSWAVTTRRRAWSQVILRCNSRSVRDQREVSEIVWRCVIGCWFSPS